MENKFEENEMYHMIGAAAACIRHSAVMRPRMGQVTNLPFPLPHFWMSGTKGLSRILCISGG
jgi:hypothetical protein